MMTELQVIGILLLAQGMAYGTVILSAVIARLVNKLRERRMK